MTVQSYYLFRHNLLRPQYMGLFPLRIMLNLHLLIHPEDVCARNDYKQVRYDNGNSVMAVIILKTNKYTKADRCGVEKYI